MNDRERQRLERELARAEDVIFRLSIANLRAEGGTTEPKKGRGAGPGRPKGSGYLTRRRMLGAYSELKRERDGAHVSQEDLADRLRASVTGVQAALAREGIGWPPTD